MRLSVNVPSFSPTLIAGGAVAGPSRKRLPVRLAAFSLEPNQAPSRNRLSLSVRALSSPPPSCQPPPFTVSPRAAMVRPRSQTATAPADVAGGSDVAGGTEIRPFSTVRPTPWMTNAGLATPQRNPRFGGEVDEML